MSSSNKKLREAALDALERLAGWLPRRTEGVDFAHQPAAVWQRGPLGGHLVGGGVLDGMALDDLLGVDTQKARLVQNTRQFVAGVPANNVLLSGARGTGKSSLIHGLLNAYAAEGLRLVEVDRQALVDLPEIVADVAALPYRFIVFCDDLSFEADDASYKVLKSVLDGSVFTTSDNVVIYATSNRRHLLPEYASENLAATHTADNEVHPGEAVEEKISLSDRFGLWLSFYPFPQQQYLDVARHWVDTYARRVGLQLPFDDAARAEALRWALARASRSGRSANHFARHWVGQHALARLND